jgi:hypothetical protein
MPAIVTFEILSGDLISARPMPLGDDSAGALFANVVDLNLEHRMARKPNYNFEKQRKEQARKQRQEEKRTRKREGNTRSDDTHRPLGPAGTPDSPPTAPAE